MKKIILVYFIISTLKSDCADSEVLKGLNFTKINSDPEIQDQEVCQEQIKKYGSCVDVDELKSLMEKQQQELVSGLEVDQELDNLLGSYQEGLQGTNLEEEFVQKREQYKENKSKCGNKLAKVNQGVLCLIASGQASQYISVQGTEITVDVNSSELEDSNSQCEPVVEAICLAGAGQSIEKDIVVDDSELTDDNSDLKNACSNIKNNKKNLIENFNTQKIKKVMPKKENMEKMEKKVKEKQENIQDKIKDKKGGEKIAKPKEQSDKEDDFEKEIKEQEKQKDGSTPQEDKPKSEQQEKPQSDKPKSDQQQKPQSEMQDKPQQDQQQKPQSEMQEKPKQDQQQKNQTQPSDKQTQNKTTDKKYRRLQSNYTLNIRQTTNGARVVTIAETSGVEDAYENNKIFEIIILSILLFFQIN